MNTPSLRYALLAGVVIFCSMSVAHFFSLKYPLLFVYYDTPYYLYQDRIISFCLIAYACLFYTAAEHRAAVPAALLALSATVLGLSAINYSEALRMINEGHSTTPYWVETSIFASYLLVLIGLYLNGPRNGVIATR